ncbi:MAG TPA: hypothetical protein VLK65_03175 [Vicinamibacteria bacterium]|nr:hypothetical protein [Vicinamibacteria bacterium]
MALREGDPNPTLVLDRWVLWARWQNLIVFGSGNHSFDALDRETGEVATLVELGEDKNPNLFTITADGEWIYYMQQDAHGSDIMLVENFVP